MKRCETRYLNPKIKNILLRKTEFVYTPIWRLHLDCDHHSAVKDQRLWYHPFLPQYVALVDEPFLGYHFLTRQPQPKIK